MEVGGIQIEINMENSIHFSVIMPTFNQCSFIRRAVGSLMGQTYSNWELIIINDGCTDETEEFISDYIQNKRVKYIKNKENTGLGHAINQGLVAAKYDYIAYLPSDDFYFPNHLETMAKTLEKDGVVLAYSGMQYDTNDTMNRNFFNQTKLVLNGHCMQLVQTVHKKQEGLCWIERNEFITEDYYLMFWNKLSDKGYFMPTNIITCFWTSHPKQRHRLLSEKYGGGINKYRNHYKPYKPLKVKVSRNKFIDEEDLYKDFHAIMPKCENPLKILVAGELAYNPERLYALEQAGHILYGLWDPHPMYTFTTVGPLPFGHVTDISYDNWESEIAVIKPDIIFGLLSCSAVSVVYDVTKAFPDIPYVWCFKEGPSMVLKMNNWEKLVYLYQHAAGRVFLNEVAEHWYNQFLPPSNTPTMLLDGELPKQDYFKESFSPKLSDTIGGTHTVVTGRMIGISEEDIKALANENIHVHLYTQNYYDGNNREGFVKLAPNHFHVHQHVFADKWTEEFSKYDAGWLHCHKSKNGGNMLMATWDDFNIPARIATYAAAGLPIILPDNTGNAVASNLITDKYDVGLLYKDREELISIIQEEVKTRRHTNNMMKCRMEFSFDYHIPRLIDFFRTAINYKKR